MYLIKTLVDLEHVFHFLNLADLSELWELEATVVCRLNDSCPFA